MLSRLQGASDRDTVVQSLLLPMLPDTTLTLLLLPKDDVAQALAAWGSPLPSDQVRALVVPLNAHSLLQQAHLNKQVCSGRTEGDTVQSMISTYLRAPDAAGGYAFPVCIGERVANLIYAQTARPIEPSELAKLTRVSASAAEAYRRLIRARRAKRA